MILAFKEANTKLCIYFCIIRRNHLPYCMNILVLHLILRCSELQADTKAKQSIIFIYFYFAEWRTANAEHFLIANHRCVMKLFTSNNVNSEIKRRIIYNFVSSNDQAPLKVCTCIFAQLLLLFTEREKMVVRWLVGFVLLRARSLLCRHLSQSPPSTSHQEHQEAGWGLLRFMRYFQFRNMEITWFRLENR